MSFFATTWQGPRVLHTPMHRDPYRVAWAPEGEKCTATWLALDRDLASVCAVVWLGSVARVLLGLVRDECLGAELLCAALAVGALPCVTLMNEILMGRGPVLMVFYANRTYGVGAFRWEIQHA